MTTRIDVNDALTALAAEAGATIADDDLNDLTHIVADRLGIGIEPRPPLAIPLDDGEVRVFEPSPADGDLGRMYVLDVFGRSLLIREREDDLYVHIGDESDSAAIDKPLTYEVNNSGENTTG